MIHIEETVKPVIFTGNLGVGGLRIMTVIITFDRSHDLVVTQRL